MTTLQRFVSVQPNIFASVVAGLRAQYVANADWVGAEYFDAGGRMVALFERNAVDTSARWLVDPDVPA